MRHDSPTGQTSLQLAAMICQFAFTHAAFERLIAYRLMSEFRPLTIPVPGPGGEPSWLDGATVDGVHLAKISADRWVALNEQNLAGQVAPSPLNEGFNASALRIGVHVTVHFATVAAVATAGTSAPTTTSVTVPAAVLGVIARVDVNAQGVAQLRIEPDMAAAPPSVVPHHVPAALTMTAPIDVGAALAGLLPPGTRVLNAGITLTDADEILLRFEMSDEGRKALVERYQGWHHFFEGQPPSHLGDQAWAVSIDGSALASAVGSQVDPLLTDKHPLYFSPGIGAEFRGGAPPRVTVSKYARIDNACAGNDVRLDVFAHLDFSVPRDNVLRGSLQVDYEKNAGDVAKCFGLAILNPLGILITAFDHGATGIGVAATAADLLVPGLKPLALLAGLSMLIAGVDQQLAMDALNGELDDEDRLTRTPNGFALDLPLEFTNDLTRDWFVLTQAAAAGNRFVLRGRSDVPAPSLPRVQAHSLDGMSPWRLRDRCEPGRGQETRGTLALDLAVGYRFGGAAPPARPTIPMRYGLRPDGGNQVYEVVGDHLGVYQDPHSEYRAVDIPGVPGTMTVKLTEATVRKTQFADFAPHPYALRLRMFTNGGVREYTFAAPPVLTSYSESIAQAAERINKCKQLTVGLVEQAILELFWRVDPPDLRRFGRQWDIHAAGLAPGQRASVFAPDRETLLTHGVANADGRVDLRTVTADTVDSVHIATDGQQPDAEPGSQQGPINVAVEQTLLTEVDRIYVPAAVEELELEAREDNLLLRIRAGQRLARRIDVAPTRLRPRPATGGAKRLMPRSDSAPVLAETSAAADIVTLSGMVTVVASDGRTVTTFRREESQIVTAQWQRTDGFPGAD